MLEFLTSSFPSSRAAWLNEGLFPALLPQKTHILLNLLLFALSSHFFCWDSSMLKGRGGGGGEEQNHLSTTPPPFILLSSPPFSLLSYGSLSLIWENNPNQYLPVNAFVLDFPTIIFFDISHFHIYLHSPYHLWQWLSTLRGPTIFLSFLLLFSPTHFGCLLLPLTCLMTWLLDPFRQALSNQTKVHLPT